MAEFTRRQIKPPRLLGEILKEARKKKELTLEQAEEETKVRAKYLMSLEKGTFTSLPDSVYTVGFLCKYAEFLGLEKEPLIEQFKRERGMSKKLSKLAPERKIKEPLFSITPKMIIISLIVLVIALVMGYILYSVRQFTLPPNLEISSPSSLQVLKKDNVEIIGKTDPNVNLLINDQTVFVDNKGNFRQQVRLNPGLNTFEVRTINQLKKQTTKIIKIVTEY